MQGDESSWMSAANLRKLRQNILTKPMFKIAKSLLPPLSETEKEALEAGDVWWDASLISGSPDWEVFENTPHPQLTKEEEKFLEGPVEQLCAMVDEWEINRTLKDLPEEVWDFLREVGFFSMIIPQTYGGLDFSSYAISEVIRRIASRSIVTAVTVMVPNSLGPGELLTLYGTIQQKNYWLPRLAKGEEIPCFGLTSPEAGSDASAMQDEGVVCRGNYMGKEVLGIRLNWHKRYITLGPVATVLGLAFKLRDPDQFLGSKKELGITVALVPTDLEGVEIGRRHLSSGQMFQNGPNWGHDVFIPLDHVIGGTKQIGKGWKMLMTALAAGRGVSLPSLSAAGAAFAARTTGSYARIREQFGIPIGKFEGVQVRPAALGARAYLLDAARRFTCAGLDKGYNLSVISAVMKTHSTYRMRESIIDAMDVHAGKAVIDGPSNYLSHLYRSLPVGITVEGANILTRNLIIFGQGVVRCHGFLLREIMALEQEDKKEGVKNFDEAFWAHVGHGFGVFAKAWFHTWTGGLFATRPESAPKEVRRFYRQLSRYSAVFAFLTEIALLTLGGSLKRKEMLSSRLGDLLSELYLLSSVLKRWENDGKHQADLAIVEYCMQEGCSLMEERIQSILKNLPLRPVAWVSKIFIQPLRARDYGPSDTLIRKNAELLLSPSDARSRITQGLYLGKTGDPTYTLERAFELVVECEPLRNKMETAGIEDFNRARELGVLSDEESEKLRQMHSLVEKVISVDHYSQEEVLGEETLNGEVKEEARTGLYH